MTNGFSLYSESLEELIKHGLRALRDTLPNEVELNQKNCSLAVVGEGQDFTVYEDDSIADYLKLIEGEEKSPGAGKPDDDAMETEDQPPADPQVAGPETMDQ